MGLHLEKIEIKRFRRIRKYSIGNLKGWTSITGPNSTGKSSIISGVSFLGSNRMYDVSDIPSWFKLTEVNPLEVPIEITYFFRLNKKFNELMSDNRIVETLISMYKLELENASQKHPTRVYRERALEYLRTNMPLGKTLGDSLYKAIRHEIEPYPHHELRPLFYSKGHFKMPEQIFTEARFFRVTLKLSLSDGPEITFTLLDEQKKPLIVDEVFQYWLDYQHVIDNRMRFAFVIGAVFIKTVTNALPEKLEISVPPTILASDGSNIRQYIEYCLAHHPDILERVYIYFERVFGQSIQFKVASPGSLIEENKILIKIVDRDGWFYIDKLSDGMFHVLKILLQFASCNKGDILVIDEPELQLHPGAARSLRDILIERKSEIQIICATHSPIFIDPSVVDVIILNENIDDVIKPHVLDAKEIDLALSELGSTGLDALLYDVVIWVEGLSDKIYLERWLHILQNEFENLTNSQVGILPYNGKTVLSHMIGNIGEFKLVNRKSAFVIDSDKKSEDDEIDLKTDQFISQCRENGIYCWLTKRRSIENYIPEDVFEKTLNLKPDTLNIGKYDDVIKVLKEVGRNERKVKLAKAIAPNITIGHIKKDKELYSELTKLINSLNLIH